MRSTVFLFDDMTSTGVDTVPVDSIVLVKDDGSGKTIEGIKISNGSLDSSSTVSDLVNNTSLFKASDNVTLPLGSISDVTLSSVSDGQSIKWDEANSKWINYTPTSGAAATIDYLNDVNNVEITDIANGQVIVWDSTNSKWINSTLEAVIHTIEALDDVALSSIQDGQVLQWNSAQSNWVNVNLRHLLSELDDIDFSTSPSSGQVLQFDGSKWKPYTLPPDVVTSVNGQTGDVSIDTDDVSEGANNKYYDDLYVYDIVNNMEINRLTDVDTSTSAPASGQVFRFDGTNWIPSGESVTSVNTKTGDVQLDTDDVPEGSNNKYYDQSAVDSSIAAIEFNDISDVDTSTNTPTSGSIVKYDGSKWSTADESVVSVNGANGVVELNTDNIPEGNTNKYYDQSAVDSSISNTTIGSLANINTSSDSASDKETLVFDGTDWVNKPLSYIAPNADSIPGGNTNKYYSESLFSQSISQTNIDSLSDVDYASAPSDGNILHFNSGHWEPTTEYVQSVNGANGEVTIGSDDIPEGQNNKYFTVQNFQNEFENSDIGNLSNVDFASSQPTANNVLTFDGTKWIAAQKDVLSVNGQSGVIALTTDDIDEGQNNKYFNQASIDSLMSSVELGHLGDVDFSLMSPVEDYVLKFRNGKWIAAPITLPPQSGNGTMIHNELIGRATNNSHPIEAISGLEDALSDLDHRLADIETTYSAINNSVSAMQTMVNELNTYAIRSNTSIVSGSRNIENIVRLNQEDYDSLTEKDEATLYIIDNIIQ